MLILRWVIAAGATVLIAQDNAPDPPTRLETIERERAEKAKHLAPETLTRSERFFETLTRRDVPDKIFGMFPGLRVKFGGLYTGSGFALGPEYFRPDLANGNAVFSASLVGSTRKYYAIETVLSFPHIAANRFEVDFMARRNYAPSVSYFGPSRFSQRRRRTNYLKEETSFDMRAGWRPFHRWLLMGASGGYTLFNTSRGREDNFPSIERFFRPLPLTTQNPVFRATLVPGLDMQSNFFRYGPFAELDFRDSAGDPHKGSHALVRYILYRDSLHSRYSFARLEIGMEHYIPVLNRKRVFAIRAKTELIYSAAGHLAPFYVQPTLGGSDDLRGFHRFRFCDNNVLVFNGEYRWEVFPALDMAAFVDTGKVFNRKNEFDLRNMEFAGGLGFRIKTRDRVAMRIDAGVGREGVRLWLKFNNAF